MNPIRPLFNAAFIGALAVAPARAEVTYRVVALSGMQAPGVSVGVTFSSFGSAPVLNSSGQTAFFATLNTTGGGVTDTSDTGIWSEGSGSLALVAREGSHAPGTPTGANFNEIRSPLLNDAGKVAFTATLQSTGGGVTTNNDAGVWSEGPGILTLVAREGSQAPGTPVGANFRFFDVLALNGSGRTAFFSVLQEGGVVTGNNSRGIWSEGSGELTLVARAGNQAPGTPPGALFDSFLTFDPPVLNDTGRSAFAASLRPGGGGGVTSINNAGIWSEGMGPLALVVREGNQAPGTPSGAIFDNFGTPALNDSGHTAFLGVLKTIGGGGGVTSADDSGIWSEGLGSLELVAREGDHAPGTPAGAVFDSFGHPLLSRSGHTTFLGTLLTNDDVTTTNDSGIWSEGSGALSLVAREGSQAPGTPAGANFNAFGIPTINSSGRLAFFATLQASGGGVTNSNNTGLWAENATGDLTLVAREGDLLEVAPGDFRTVYSLNFAGKSGGEDGRAVAFNDNFTLVFRAVFTDGASAIFTAALVVPEPASLGLIAFGSLGLLLRQRSIGYERTGR